MAQTTTTELSAFIPEVWSSTIALELPHKVVLSNIATTLNDLQGKAGDTIHVPKINLLDEADDLSEGTSMTATALSTSDITTTIREVGKGVELTYKAANQSLIDPNTLAVQQITESIARKIDTSAIYEVYTNCPSGNIKDVTGETTKTFTAEYVADTLAFMGDNKSDDLALLIHSKQHSNALKDGSLVDASKYGNDSVMRQGVVGTVYGIPVFISDRVPSNRATLRAGIDNSVTTVPVWSTAGFPTSGYVIIGTEAIQYTGITETTFTGCTRAADSTSAAAHLKGVAVAEYDASGNVAVTQSYHALLVKRNGLYLAYQRLPLVEFDKDIMARSNKVAGTTTYATKLVNTDFVAMLKTQ